MAGPGLVHRTGRGPDPTGRVEQLGRRERGVFRAGDDQDAPVSQRGRGHSEGARRGHRVDLGPAVRPWAVDSADSVVEPGSVSMGWPPAMRTLPSGRPATAGDRRARCGWAIVVHVPSIGSNSRTSSPMTIVRPADAPTATSPPGGGPGHRPAPTRPGDRGAGKPRRTRHDRETGRRHWGRPRAPASRPIATTVASAPRPRWRRRRRAAGRREGQGQSARPRGPVAGAPPGPPARRARRGPPGSSPSSYSSHPASVVSNGSIDGHWTGSRRGSGSISASSAARLALSARLRHERMVPMGSRASRRLVERQAEIEVDDDRGTLLADSRPKAPLELVAEGDRDGESFSRPRPRALPVGVERDLDDASRAARRATP